MQSATYLFGYKTKFFSFQNNPKNLDMSSKTDLDLCNCLGRIKLHITAKFHGTDLFNCDHSRDGKTPVSYPINTVIKSSVCNRVCVYVCYICQQKYVDMQMKIFFKKVA